MGGARPLGRAGGRDDGFFTAAQSAAMLEREVAGDWPAGLFATFATHGAALEPGQRRHVAAQTVEKYRASRLRGTR